MKVKVGDMVFDAANNLIMVILGPKDKENISNMAPEATKYCCAPEGTSEKEMKRFMEIGQDAR